MKEYPKILLICAKTRAEVVKDGYSEDEFLVSIMQRIIEDIDIAIEFEDMEIPNEVSHKEKTHGI